MKTATTISLLAAALAAGSLTSCVDTYNAGGPGYGGPGHGGPGGYRPGYVVQTLPPRYETVTVSGVRYYRHDNVYYRSQGRGYVVVEEPRRGGGGPSRPDFDRRGSDWDRRGPDRGPDWDRRGSDSRGPDRDDWNPSRGPRPGGHEVSVIRTLPRGYKVVTRGGERYYTHNNVYYQQRNGGYVVVTPR